MSKGKWELEKRIDTINNRMKSNIKKNKNRDENIKELNERVKSLERRINEMPRLRVLP